LLKASLKNPFRPVACPPVVAVICGSCRSLLVEFLTVHVCAFFLLAWVCPAAPDLAIVVLLI
jgi:hypothetical protein